MRFISGSTRISRWAVDKNPIENFHDFYDGNEKQLNTSKFYHIIIDDFFTNE
jgi:hypothetical protein